MNNVTRINGFIDLDELCKSPEFRNIPWKTNESSVEEYGYSNVQYIFIYNNEIWIYKYVGESFSYAELVAEELAKCFSLPTAHYDLAFAKQYGKGVISRNFKLKNASYIKGHTILSDYIKAVLQINDTKKIEDEVKKYNSLEGIWNALEWYYRNNHNKSEIVQKLMGQIVNMFIYDMITGNTDRHEYNWGIVENEEEINLQPLFDNERILYFDSNFRMHPHIESGKDVFLEFTKQVEKIILEFISVSESEYLLKYKKNYYLLKKKI